MLRNVIPKETGKKSTKKRRRKQNVIRGEAYNPSLLLGRVCQKSKSLIAAFYLTVRSVSAGDMPRRLASSVSRRGSFTRPRAIELDASKHIDVLYLLNQIIFLRSKRKETYQKKNGEYILPDNIRLRCVKSDLNSGGVNYTYQEEKCKFDVCEPLNISPIDSPNF